MLLNAYIKASNNLTVRQRMTNDQDRNISKCYRFLRVHYRCPCPSSKKRDALNTTLHFYYSSYHMEVKVLVNGYHDITVGHAQSMIGEKG